MNDYTPYPPTAAERLATQKHSLFSILVQHCGQTLTASKIDVILEEMVQEMQRGPTSWAFKPQTTKS